MATKYNGDLRVGMKLRLYDARYIGLGTVNYVNKRNTKAECEVITYNKTTCLHWSISRRNRTDGWGGDNEYGYVELDTINWRDILSDTNGR